MIVQILTVSRTKGRLLLILNIFVKHYDNKKYIGL